MQERTTALARANEEIRRFTAMVSRDLRAPLMTLKGFVNELRASDLSQVVQIEPQAFPSPWPQEVFCDCLKAGMSCWVVEHNGMVKAYRVMSIETTHAQILDVCVRPDIQRHGFGRWLLAHFIEVARAHHVKTVRLEVRPSNTAALRLYTSMGCTEIGRKKAYYLRHKVMKMPWSWRDGCNTYQES